VDPSRGDRVSETTRRAAMAAEAVIRRLYAAIEGRDVDAVVDLVMTDVFVLPANADAGVLGREHLIAELRRRFVEPGAADLEHHLTQALRTVSVGRPSGFRCLQPPSVP